MVNEPDDIDDDAIGEEWDEDEAEREDDDDEEPLMMRTAVMAKSDLLALLCLKVSTQGGVIVRVDPRQRVPAGRTYEDAALATEWFNRSLSTSRRNGWSVVYVGEPLFG